VILPQAGILSLPSLFANFIFLLKETTVVSAVAVPEILYTTKSYIAPKPKVVSESAATN